MKCLSNTIIQKYIDKETTIAENLKVEQHISACEKCAHRIEGQKSFIAYLIKQTDANTESVVIPEFRKPTDIVVLPHFKIRKKHIFQIAAAACLLFAIFFGFYQKKPKEKYIIIYGMNNNFDANKAYYEQENDFLVIDQDGNIVNLFQ